MEAWIPDTELVYHMYVSLTVHIVSITVCHFFLQLFFSSACALLILKQLQLVTSSIIIIVTQFLPCHSDLVMRCFLLIINCF